MKVGKAGKLLAGVLCAALLCMDMTSLGTTAFATEPEPTYGYEAADNQESAAIEETDANAEPEPSKEETETWKTEMLETETSKTETAKTETSETEISETENADSKDSKEELSETMSLEDNGTEQESAEESTASASEILTESTEESESAESTDSETETVSEEDILRLSGEGTKDSPYLITTEADLTAIANGLNKVYQLQNDITLSNAWTPIGTYARAFSGTFDGNGHTISGVVINSSVEVDRSGNTSYNGYGFFGRNNGTVKNLTIKGTVTGGDKYSGLVTAYNTGTIENVTVQNATVTGKEHTGLLAGYSAESGVISGCSASGAAAGSGSCMGGLAGSSAGKITDSRADVTVSNSYSMNGPTGGFVGTNTGSIEDSRSTGTVSNKSSSLYSYTGGFVGTNAEGAVIANCSSSAAVKNSSYYTGGFVGNNAGSIEGSRASGNVEESSAFSGGFCGANTGMLTRCLSSGSVNSTGQYTGGFVGYSEGGTAQYSGSTGAVTSGKGNAGGFAGYAESKSMIANCYSNGDVTGSADNVGGFIGCVSDSLSVVSYCYASGVVSNGSYAKGGFAGNNSGKITFTSCYYDKNTSGLSDTGNGEPKTTAQMKQKATYEGWGFDGAWGIESSRNSGYPYLLWEGKSGAPEPVVPSETLSGEGTEASPYLIKSEADLLAVSREPDKAYRLEDDIPLSSAWTPMGTYEKPFSGTFDGNGHTISGLTVYSSVEVHKSGSTSYKGIALFGRNSGTIKNLKLNGAVSGNVDYSGVAAAYSTGTLDNVSVTGVVSGKENTGLIAGYSAESGVISGCSASGAAAGSGSCTGGLAGSSAGKITDSRADVTVSNSYSMNGPTGGFVGTNTGSIEDSRSTGTVSNKSSSLYSYTGGFVGTNAEGAAIVNCSSGAAVKNSSYYTGGFVGNNAGSIEGSRASGNVEESSAFSGGFCGANTGMLTRCLSSGSVNSTGQYTGGFVGHSEGGTAQYSGSTGAVTSGKGNAGGFAGYAGYKDMITNCYARGDVTGSADNVGGFIGCVSDSLIVVSYCYASGVVSNGSYAKGGFAGNNSGKITFLSCYYDKDTSGLSDTGNGEPKTTAQMKQKATYEGWGFGGAWGLESSRNSGYPYLLWENKSGAQEPVVPSETLSGEGTESNPYLIKSEADLLAVSRGLDKAYRLENDIPLSSAWTPMGTYEKPFSGTFDGNGHTISGLTVCDSVEVHKSGSTSYKGIALFGRNSGTIKNLKLNGAVSGNVDYSGVAAAYSTGTLDNVSVTGVVSGKGNTGLLAGYSAESGVISGCSVSGATTSSYVQTGGLVGSSAGKITDSSAEATVSGSGSGSYTGGFIGHNTGSIEDSRSTGTVSNKSSSLYSYAGGFVGTNAEGAVIANCSSSAAVKNSSYYTGGFVGNNAGSIEGSRASGNVEESSAFSGGFCGANTGMLTRCLSSGSVNSTGQYTGGFVGHSEGGTAQYSGSTGAVTSGKGNAGGFAGYAGYKDMITNCYARGDVTGSADNVGGFIGCVSDSLSVVSYCYASGVVSNGTYAKGGFAGNNSGKITFTSCYYDKDTSGLSDTGNGEPKTTAQMKQKSTYEGWGFDGVWGLESSKNSGYPYLLWEEQEWISVKSISLTPTSVSLKVGEQQQLTVTILPENASDKSVTWKSSDNAVATVENGLVTAVKAGTAKITVSNASGSRTADCEVTITEIEAKTYTVKFETNGGSHINDISVTEGEKITKPTDPVREGYVFKGWYSDAECTHEWDFANSTVTADMTLYVKWEAIETKSYTVKFETNGGNQIKDISVAEGEKITKPADPVREGYVFKGWYSDAECTHEWDFANGTVTADMTLYAKWATVGAKSYTVKFETNGGSQIKDISVTEGEKITKPADPTREEYRFEGWYSDAEYTHEWDFSKDMVTADTILYAKWKWIEEGTEKDNYSVYEEQQRTSLNNCTIASVKSKAYDGKAYNPTPKVTLNVSGTDKKLVYGTDYRLVYSDDVNAGTGTVTVVGIGSYCGRKAQNFTITKKDMKKLKAVVSSVAVGDLSAFPIEVYDGTKRLQKGVDYDYQITASNIGSEGNAEIEVLSLQDSNYLGTMTVKVPVIDTNGKNLIHNSDITLDVTECKYNGKAQKPNVTVTVGGVGLVMKQDYSVTYKNNKNAGTAYVIVKGKGKSYTGTATAFFTIKPANSESNGFDSVIVNKGKAVIYNGKLQKPSVVVKTGGKKLSAKKDYVIEYTNNLIAGTGYVKITGVNNYEGLTSTVPFMINPTPIKKASIKAKTTTDYTLKFNGKVLIKGVDYDVIISEPHNNGKVDITFTGLKNFNASIIKKNVKQGSSQ